MPVELTVLALAALLAAVQLMLYAVPANRDVGTEWTMGPRDDPMPEGLGVRTDRLRRAFQNHVEGLVFFIAAVLVVIGADRSSALTSGAAWVYLGARLAYVPLYWAGVRLWRSVVWSVGFFATMAMIVAALAGA